MSNPLIIEAVPGTSYADITREFDAPVEAVFAAHTDRDLFASWIGPGENRTTITEWECRTGGSWAYSSRGDDDVDYNFRGSFHTVRANEIIVQTFEFEGYPDVVSIDVMRFESLPEGRSRIVAHSVFPTIEALEGMIASGMEGGMDEGYKKLDAILARG